MLSWSLIYAAVSCEMNLIFQVIRNAWVAFQSAAFSFPHDSCWVLFAKAFPWVMYLLERLPRGGEETKPNINKISLASPQNP